MGPTGLGPPHDAPVYANNPLRIKSLPFSGHIRQLHAGELVIIDGFIPAKSKGLTVGLQYIQGGNKVDTLLQVDLRLGQNVLLLNSQTNGQWEIEEKVNGVGDLKANHTMEIIILVHITGFKISLNGRHMAFFKHRAPYKYINNLSLQGSALLHSVSFQQGPRGVYAGTAMPLRSHREPQASSAESDTSQKEHALFFPEIFGVTAPWQEFIPGGLSPGRFVYVSCLPTKTAARFEINFSPNNSSSRKDIALHFRVDFGHQRALVLNDQENDKWGRELRPDCRYLFGRGVHSDILIQCTPHAFMISVNNQHVTEFEHRLKRLETVSWLEVTGDTKIVHARVY